MLFAKINRKITQLVLLMDLHFKFERYRHEILKPLSKQASETIKE